MKHKIFALALAGLLSGCGVGQNDAPGAQTASPAGGGGAGAPAAQAAPAAEKPGLFASAIQYLSAGTVAEVKTYAASRFLDHASFGPTDAAIADVKARGMAGWIDQQFTLTPSKVNVDFSENWNSDDTPGLLGRPYYELFRRQFSTLTLSAPDQLRLRTTWALSQFIVVSESKIQSFATGQYFNLLQDNSFGNFKDLLRTVAKSPSMGIYLDNTANKKAGACDVCSVNENFARELMQLFTLGVTRLNRDGSAVRDGSGKLVETYSQDDVQAMARALTGWELVQNPAEGKLRSHYRYPMVARWADSHDSDEKKLLGKVIPAGGSAEKDLEAVLTILMEHPNIAPFVSLRLIQHLVTSDPSPAYLERIAKVFEDNGSGVRGDLKAVVRAILLDTEARRADDAAYAERSVGKLREPVLHTSAMLRGLGCTQIFSHPNGYMYGGTTQQPFNAASVFSFFAPTYRAPGSLLLAPEQKLLTSDEFSSRLGGLSWTASQAPQNLADAGCRMDLLASALSSSKRDFLNLVSQHYFRGSMTPVLREFGETLIDQITWGTPVERAATVLQFLLTSPAYGVIK